MKSQKKATKGDKKPEAKKQKNSNLKELVKKNKNFQFMENGKIKCTLTGHEMQATVENFNSYLKSKSYRRGLQSQFDISQYEQILIEHKNNPKFVFCQLTGFKIPKKKSALQKHVNGKKFQRRLKQLRQQQQNGNQEHQQDVQNEQEDQEDEQDQMEEDPRN